MQTKLTKFIALSRTERRAVALICISLFQLGALAQNKPITVAVSLDIPPFVMDHGKRGAEIYLMRRAFPSFRMNWVQMDYAALESAVADEKADIAMSVQQQQTGVYYSKDYIGFANFAICKRSDRLEIRTISDLKGHRVLTWENAWTELGDEFKNQYSPGSSERTNYVEVANQAEQVRRFWESPGTVIVIDRSIFDYFSDKQGHRPDEVEYKSLFPRVTKFKVAFADASLRDKFNEQLTQWCDSGEYQRIMKLHKMSDVAGVCDK